MPTRGLSLPRGNDTRLFLVGLGLSLALVVYLAVAFADIPVPPVTVVSPSLARKVT